jgi:hypothetical protein
MAVPGTTELASKLDDEIAARSDVKPGSTSPAFRGGNTFLGNMTGLPAITIPCGFSKGPPELPIAIQFYGKPFDEATILRTAHAYESATNRQEAPPRGGYFDGRSVNRCSHVLPQRMVRMPVSRAASQAGRRSCFFRRLRLLLPFGERR